MQDSNENSIGIRSQKANNNELKTSSEFVNTEGAAKYLSFLLGRNFTPNAIRIRVHRGQLKPIKPFGLHGESYFKIFELRQRFTRSHKE